MSVLRRLAEKRITEAIDRGVFDNLQGAGRPLDLGEDAHVPVAVRAIHRVLKPGGRMRVSDIVVERLPRWMRSIPSVMSLTAPQ